MAPVKSQLMKLWIVVTLSSIISAAPVDREVTGLIKVETMPLSDNGYLAKRVSGNLGSEENPIKATMTTENWPNIAEENCYVMLCLRGGQRVYQRVATQKGAKDNLSKSGTKLQPFAKSETAARGTEQINSETTSAEEFPWRSIRINPNDPNDNSGRTLAPTTVEEQSSQGGSILSAYQSPDNPVGLSKYFEITFAPPSSGFGIYCAALFQEPPDFSVCKKKGKETLFGTTEIDPSEFIWLKNDGNGTGKGRGKGKIGFHHVYPSS